MNLIEVVRQCHNHDPWQDTTLKPLLLSSKGVQLGFIREVVAKAIQESGGQVAFAWDKEGTKYWIKDELQSQSDRSNALRKVVEDWRDQNLFPDPLKGWRNELYAVFGTSSEEKGSTSCVFHLERSACALFGFATFGVHATAYTVPDYHIWVPKRASTKATWPGYLDNSAAGGISAGDMPFESMVRECGEEAGLEEDVVRRLMKQTGVISYFYCSSPCNWVQSEIEYTYDIPLDSSVKLHPVDGEAEDFQLMTIDQILDLMKRGKFKANCAMVLIDFLIRHGKLTAENAGCDYLELVCLLHNNLRLPSMKIMQ